MLKSINALILILIILLIPLECFSQNKYKDDYITALYPENWNFELNFEYQKVCFYSPDDPNEALFLSIAHSKCQKEEPLNKVWSQKKERLDYCKFISEETVNINEVAWIKAVLKEKNYGGTLDYTKVLCFTVVNNRAHWIQFNSGTKDLSTNIEILNNFIQSLRFTE